MDPDLRREVDDLKTRSTSDEDLRQMMGYNIRIVKYNELIGYDSIDDLLGPRGECIILYETAPNIGHWVCIYRIGNLVSFFDSYGLKPDDQFHKICIKFRRSNGIRKPYLTYLLSDSRYKVEYSDYPLQNKADDIATCGLWCIQRLKIKGLDPEGFAKLYRDGQGFDSDDLVVLSNF